MKLLKDLLEIIRAQQEYIDAIPTETAAVFPAMPGFDRDWADTVVSDAELVLKHMADVECAICGDGSARVQVTRYCSECTSDYAGVSEYLASKILSK